MFSLCHDFRTLFAFSLKERVASALLPPLCMPSGTQEYREYTIYWDTMSPPDANLWKAKAGIVCPPDTFGIATTILGITGDRFKSEAEAREYVLRAAKERVDERLDGLVGLAHIERKEPPSRKAPIKPPTGRKKPPIKEPPDPPNPGHRRRDDQAPIGDPPPKRGPKRVLYSFPA
jgi:hypothetical protein